MRITFERRRSDFERDARVTPFTGSCCCCCCCLHWVGAAVGGIVGMRSGWVAGEKRLGAPLPAEGASALRGGLALGIIAGVGAILGSIFLAVSSTSVGMIGSVYLIALAFVPPVALIPVGLVMVLSTYRTRQKMLSAYRADIARLPPKDGGGTGMSLYRAKLTPAPKTHSNIVQFSVFCRHCWTDLGEHMHLTTCPECNEAIGRPVISGPDYGVSVAWRAAGTSIAAATTGALVGYVIMAVIAAIISAVS
jgi:hypothetical protein